MKQGFGPRPIAEITGWTGTGNHNARPEYAQAKVPERTPIYDQLVLERAAKDPATIRLATAIVTDADSRNWGLPWTRKWRG